MKNKLMPLLGLFFIGLILFFIFDISKSEEVVPNDVVTTASKHNDNVYYSIDKELHFNLGIDTHVLEFFERENKSIGEANTNKMGFGLEKSSMNVYFFDFKNIEATTLAEKNYEEFDAKTKGVMRTPEGNFNFESDGYLHVVKLSDEQTIYSGRFKGNFKNKQTEEAFFLTMRFNPETEQIDVSFTSGVIGDNAILSFGKSFITDAQFNEIEETIRR